MTSASNIAILEIVPYWVLKNPSAPSLIASDIWKTKNKFRSTHSSHLFPSVEYLNT